MKNTDEKIDELARIIAKGFAHTATKDDIANMATKDDLAMLRDDIDHMLNRTVGVFRKDFDGLAERVKRLEETVFSR